MCHPSNFENHRLNQYCCQLTWFSNVFEATHRKRTGALQVRWRRASEKPIMGRSSSSRGKKGIRIESHLQNQRGFPLPWPVLYHFSSSWDIAVASKQLTFWDRWNQIAFGIPHENVNLPFGSQIIHTIWPFTFISQSTPAPKAADSRFPFQTIPSMPDPSTQINGSGSTASTSVNSLGHEKFGSSQAIVEPRMICPNASVFTKGWPVQGRLV